MNGMNGVNILSKSLKWLAAIFVGTAVLVWNPAELRAETEATDGLVIEEISDEVAPEQAGEIGSQSSVELDDVAANDEEGESEDGDEFQSFNLAYYGIFYGPSVQNPSSLQVTANGARDPDRPLELRNFASLAYNVNETVSVAPTMYWAYFPVRGQKMVMRDPFLRVSFNNIIDTADGLNLYADGRVHFAVSNESRQADLLGGLQSLQSISYDFAGSRFAVGMYSSVRYNYFGKKGSGNDLEVYAAPNAYFRISPTLQASLVYEMAASHAYGAPMGKLVSDGTNLNPGLLWDITPNVMVNPYLVLYPSEGVSLKNTSFGMLFSVGLI